MRNIYIFRSYSARGKIMKRIIKSIERGDVDIDILLDNWISSNFSSTKLEEFFCEFASYLTDEQFWHCLHAIWPHFDNINHEAYSELFLKRQKGWRSSYLSEKNIAFYDSLDKDITVYRGQNDDFFTGLSWTTNRNTAIKFAYSHKSIYNPRPVIIEGLAYKKDIAGVYTERNENEIIFFHEFDIDFVNSECLTECEKAEFKRKKTLKDKGIHYH